MKGDCEERQDTDHLLPSSPGCQPNSGQPKPEQPGFHYCPATLLLLGATDHPLALHGLLDDGLLPLHVGQVAEGKGGAACEGWGTTKASGSRGYDLFCRV